MFYKAITWLKKLINHLSGLLTEAPLSLIGTISVPLIKAANPPLLLGGQKVKL